MMLARKVEGGVSGGEHLMKFGGECTESELTLFGATLQFDKHIAITQIPIGGLTRACADGVDDLRPVFLAWTERGVERLAFVKHIIVGCLPDFVLDEPRGIGDKTTPTGGVEGLDELHDNGSPQAVIETDEEHSYFLIDIPCHPDFIKEQVILNHDGVKDGVKGGVKELTERQKAIIEMISADPFLSAKTISEKDFGKDFGKERGKVYCFRQDH